MFDWVVDWLSRFIVVLYWKDSFVVLRLGVEVLRYSVVAIRNLICDVRLELD